MIYNLADTFFIGQIGDPYMVAAVSLVSPWFNLLTALGNLFGIGGSSLISRMLGAHNHGDIRFVSAFSIWGGAAATLVFSAATYFQRDVLLDFLGASRQTMEYAESYMFWVVVLGGAPTVVSLVLGHLLRSEGFARQASAGMMFGGVLNVALDPLLIFVIRMDVTGAAVATALSNTASVIFFSVQYFRLGEKAAVSLNPIFFTIRFVRPVFFSGTCFGACHCAWKYVQYGYGETGGRIRRYTGSGVWDSKEDRSGVFKCVYGTLSGIHASRRLQLCVRKLQTYADVSVFFLENGFGDIRLFYNLLRCFLLMG